jgi:hypothetical protein
MGQERPVLVIDLVAEGTYDLRQIALTEAKTDQQMRALGKADLLSLAT